MAESNLTKKHCIPCEAGTPPMPDSLAEEMLKQVPGWSKQDNQIKREFKFKNFMQSMEFVNKVAGVAESEDHHPDIYIFYSIVKLTLWTHAAGGLTENDFILAAKINEIE